MSSDKITKKDLRKIYLRYFALNCMNDYPGQMHNGYTFSLLPVLKKIYADNKEKRVDAYKRHMNEYINVTPYIAGLPMGITIAMEEENAKSDNFDTTTIATMKTSLMGPLSAIGDTIFHSTLRIIATAVIVELASQGNFMAPVIFLLVFNIPNIIARYYSLTAGYHMGVGFISKAEESGIMDKISYASSVVGLMAIGAMTAVNVKLSTAITFGGGIGDEIEPTKLQSLLDSIMPKMLPLCLVGIIYYLLGKKVGVVPLLIGLLVVGVILYSFGIIA
ncbi:PTS system mannose/fructose/sorbose family transporter subunit IID [Lacrimispora sp.]|uniref:PTS system mannose/fructose/sorbose family transporter subunit IID n=1 Tax=Lacrimispora sp. TaxID=2719234 RepID=UPI0028A25BDF|nr:PTS system mannose/fructose/sorbose family transporter subunit IID [Lacrimispora sp.]